MHLHTSALNFSYLLLSSALLTASLLAKGHEPEHFVTLNGDHIATVLGASREAHAMVSLEKFGAPTEYVNSDLERLNLNEGPCIFVARLSKAAPDLTSEVDVECFDLVAETESKSVAYTADSKGEVINGGKLSPIGKYGKGDAAFDLAAWKWVAGHVSPELERSVEAERSQGRQNSLATVYSPHPGTQQGSDVTAPVLIHSVNAQFSESARIAHISGTATLSFVVDENGLPRHICSVLPLGYGMDEEAVRAVQQYRFRPAKFQGKPVPVRITIDVHFHQI